MWQCPICAKPLALANKSWRCENNHTFDCAKSGYVNLLPVQQKKSKQPGDDKTMVRARQHFHQQGGYQPLMNWLADEIKCHFAAQDHVHIYDAGCGEGSYLASICEQLQTQGVQVTGAGSDISKIAVELASKVYKQQHFAVATSVNLPVPDNSLDVVIQVFAPGSSNEYSRVLKKGGLLVTVDPAAKHLWELKTQIYASPEQHDETLVTRANFELIKDERLGFDVKLSTTQQRTSLLQMTPYYWKLNSQRCDSLIQSLESVSAQFAIRVWENKA